MRNFSRFNGNAKTAFTKTTYLCTLSNLKSTGRNDVFPYFVNQRIHEDAYTGRPVAPLLKHGDLG